MMNRCPTFILRCAVFVAGLAVLAICGFALWIALTETNPDSPYYYLSHIMLIGVWLAAVPFYTALYQAMRLLNLIDTNHAFSECSLKALTVIMRCAIIVFIICTAAGLPFFYAVAQIEDAPGLVIIGMFISGSAFIIAVFASVLTRLLHEAIEMKTENDLTI